MRISGTVFRHLVHNAPDILEDLFWQQIDHVRALAHLLQDHM